MNSIAVARPAPRVGAFLLAWLLAALAAGGAGLVERYPLPLPTLAVGLTAVLLVTLRVSAQLRAWLWARGPAPLISLHLSRFIGIAFLVLAARGALPASWALPSGWGDIVVAAAAVPVLLYARPFHTAGRRRALLAWNVLGLADLLMVVGGAVRMLAFDPSAGSVMQRLPMCLLPTFLVPLLLASHVLIFAWLARTARAW